jgi:protein required for attachment to host cells
MTRQTNFDPRWARRGESLVVVADGGRARILKREGRRFAPQLLELERLERSSAHRHARDMTTDLSGRLSGRIFSSARPANNTAPRVTARHGAQSDYDPHTVEVERFARQIATRLARLARQRPVQELVLIASPRFLGVLRRSLSNSQRQVVSREIPRDLTGALPQPILRAAFSLPPSSSPSAASPG